jgi:dolichyl-phosphate beta-glucosyltransferase
VQRSLSIIVPAYDEETRLPQSLRRIHSFLVERGYDAEVIVVDDGSHDGTCARVEELKASLPLLRVLSYPVNMGKGFAVKTGVLAATRSTILVTDADLSTPLENIDRFWSWYDQGYPVVIGSRGLPQSELVVRQRILREGMGRIFNRVISFLGVRGIHDTQCGFKVFSTAAAQVLFSNLKTNGFAFDVEILMRARNARMKIAEVPVQWINSPASKVRIVRDSMRMLLDVLCMQRELRKKS